MLVFNFFLTALLIPYTTFAHYRGDWELSSVRQSIIGSWAIHELQSYHTRARLIEKSTAQIQSNLYNAAEILTLSGFIPDFLKPTLDQWNHIPLSGFTNKEFQDIKRLLTLILLVNERLSNPRKVAPQRMPKEEKSVLMQSLLMIQDIHHHSKLKVMFLPQNNLDFSMFDNAIATSLGVLVITVPNQLMNKLSWYINGRYCKPLVVLKEKLLCQFRKILLMEKVGSVVRIPAATSFYSILFRRIWAYCGYDPMPFEQNTSEPFLQTYSKHLLRHLKHTKPPSALVPPDSPPYEDALWQIVMIDHYLQGEAQVFFDHPEISIPTCPKFRLPGQLDPMHPLQKKFQRTVEATFNFNPSVFIPPTRPLRVLNQDFKEMWCPQCRDCIGTAPAEAALLEADKIMFLRSQLAHSGISPPENLMVRCALWDKPVYELQKVELGILILFPTQKVLRGISSLHKYIQFATSHEAVYTALKFYKRSGLAVRKIFEKRLKNRTAEEYWKLNSVRHKTEIYDAYQRFLARGIP